MSLDGDQLRTLSGLLDQALDMPEPDRAAWLGALGNEYQALKPMLETMLSRQSGVETADFLDTLPRFDVDGDGRDCSPSGLSSGDSIGPYRLLHELGRGGMGEVWLAERADGLYQRPVALKLPAMAMPQRTLAERFAREREILAPLNHPHIARLYDAGFAGDGQPYLALEYVEGEAITVRCDARRADIRSRLALFLQALAAVQYAHMNLVLHRDLKPSNIMVTPEGEVKLLDFGIAKLMEEGSAVETELTRLAGHALTLDYASPEQVTGAALTTAADIYSLGVVLYELLTGERPYRLRRGTRGELEEAIAALDPPPPSRAVANAAAAARGTNSAKLRRMLAGDLDTIVLKALNKAPDQRYGSAQAMADDLERHLNGLPILARPATGWYRTVRFVRRNAIPVSAGAVVAAALIGASIVSWTLMQRAERAAVRARHEATVATAVQTFMTDLFRTNTVDQHFDKRVRDMTAAELLDRGALAIENSLDDAPSAKASLLQLFGEMYEDLGLADRALKMHEKSVVAAARVYGEDSPEFALALLEKAWVTNLVDKNTDAPLKMVEQAKRILAARAPGTEDYAEALYMEAHMVMDADAARAVASGEEAVRIVDRLGATDKRAVFAKQELATAYRKQGDFAQSARAMAASIAGFERLYGADSRDVAFGRNGLALVLYEQLRLQEAEEQFRAAIAILEKYPSLRTQGAVFFRLQLATLLAARGRYTEAYAEMDAIEEIRRNVTDTFPLPPRQVQFVRASTRLAQGDPERGLSEMLAASSDPTAFVRRMMISPSVVQETLARGYLLAGDLVQARTAIDAARTIAAREGTTPLRNLWIALREAEVGANEGKPEAGLQAIAAAENKYAVAAKSNEAHLNIALARARIAATTGRTADVITLLAPWLDRPLEPGVELPAAVRAEMLLLSGEALAASSSPDARKRLLEAQAAIDLNDVPWSRRRTRVNAGISRLPG